jgi:hypothetical protein
MERLRRGMKTIYDWMGDLFTRWGEVAAGIPRVAPRPDDEDDDELFATAPALGRGGYSDEGE